MSLKAGIRRLSGELARLTDRRDYAALLREAKARATRGEPPPALDPASPYACRLARARTLAQRLRASASDA
jgi:hypothetical protein